MKAGGSIQGARQSFKERFGLVVVIFAINYPCVQVAARLAGEAFQKMLKK